jgi:murein DD-endopeptidase MepM/ murein hydrolase activator NlpD
MAMDRDTNAHNITGGEQPAAEGRAKAKLSFLGIFYLAAAFIIVVAVALVAALRGERLLPAYVYAAMESAQAEAVVEPTPEPTPAATAQPSPAPSAAPSPSAPEATYQKTAVVIDGERAGVLASVQAATQLLEEIKDYRVDEVRQAGATGEITAEFESEVSLEAADAGEETLTADALKAALIGKDTPLKVVCTVTQEAREAIPYKTQTQSDKYLVEGTKIIASMGAAGEKVTLSRTVYVNGKKKSSDTETQVIAEAQDALLRTGAQKVTSTREPGRSEGKTGPDTELTFVSPMADGSVVLNFGQSGSVLHLGLDYEPKAEDAGVVASCAGVVVCVMERGGYGLMVEIDHGDGFVTRYAHLERADVKIGQRVAQGERIGIAAAADTASEEAEKPLLHFEVRIAGEAYNPRQYVK